MQHTIYLAATIGFELLKSETQWVKETERLAGEEHEQEKYKQRHTMEPRIKKERAK